MEWVWVGIAMGLLFTLVGFAESSIGFVWTGLITTCVSMWLLVALMLVGVVS